VLKSGVIEYKHDSYECEGFAVRDDAAAKRPGVLIFPEWVGVGEYTYKRAQMLGDPHIFPLSIHAATVFKYPLYGR
jgi:hypothetical protein